MSDTETKFLPAPSRIPICAVWPSVGKTTQRLRAARALSSSENHPLQDRKILFVDDDPAISLVFARSFSYTGAQIDVADGPVQALKMAEVTAYQIIVTDLQMPRMNGIELIDTLWRSRPETSYILVTGVIELNLPTDSVSARAISSMLRKPWLPEQMDHALVQAIELYEARMGQREGSSSHASTLRVLLLEDVEVGQGRVASLLSSWVGDLQFETSRVSRLSAGIRQLRDGGHDVVIADLSLPDARGLDTVAGIKRIAPELPILVMSAADDEMLAMQAVKAGAQEYLVKSEVTGAALCRAIRYALERKKTQRHLEYLAHHDRLTGLANRTLFSAKASRIIAQAWRRDTKPALLLLDLDRFKNTNDTLGHSVGDELLVKVAERLSRCLGGKGSLARLGGDEFAMIIEQQRTKEEASVLARRLLGCLEPDFLIGDHKISIRGSIGITIFPEDGNDVDQLLSNADAAMYRAKEIGRNRYEYFDNAMHARAVRWMQLERELRGALERGEFELHYQPQVSCLSNEVISFEALLRWTHKELGPIGPFQFVPVLEGIGLIDQVGEWVIREACAQLARWRAYSPNLRMAVNVSAIQFEKDNLASIVRSALKETGLPEDALELEITEGLLMKDFNKTLQTLNELNDSGVRIAIDDFGTGYSNLSYLARYPIDVLKIDKSITDMVGAHEGNSIARAVVDLSHALGIEVLAEGVETEAQLRFLSDTKVEIYQGYYHSKPMSSLECEQLLGYSPTPSRHRLKSPSRTRTEESAVG